MSFFSELKRRNVFRVGAAYLVVAWLLVQVVDTLGDMFAMPEAFGRGVVILLVIGFPVALIISWIYEMTPKGVVTQEAVDAGIKTTSGRKLNTVIIGGLALALVMVILDAYVINDTVPVDQGNDVVQSETALPDLEKSIAVLPFDNLSAGQDQEYFSDGLTEELINKLSQVNDLLVTGRNSSFYYKGRNEELRDIGETLGVTYVLQGGVRKAGGQMRISAQLTDTTTNTNLWSDTFDRELSDVFAIQDEIAAAITTALSITIGAGEFNQPGLTSNLEAYDAFLKAREGFNAFSPAGSASAVDFIEQAVRLDPDFLDAWILMEDIYDRARGLSPIASQEQLLARRNEAQARVRAMDPDSHRILIWNLETAFQQEGYLGIETGLLEALDITGESDSRILENYANFLGRVGRTRDALVAIQKARRLDPLDPLGTRLHIDILFELGRVDEANAMIDRAMEQENTEQLVGYKVWGVINENTDPDALVAFLEEKERLVEGAGNTTALLEAARLWQQGDVNASLAVIENYMKGEENPVNYRLLMVVIPIAMQNYQFAFDISEVTGAIPGAWMPAFSEGRKLPEFKEKVRAAGFADYWRSSGNWPDKCRPLEGSDDFECF